MKYCLNQEKDITGLMKKDNKWKKDTLRLETGYKSLIYRVMNPQLWNAIIEALQKFSINFYTKMVQ